MQTINNLDQWRALRATFPANLKIGFVPTMGNLHLGHISLCDKSMTENELTIVSIFINPKQFNNPEDFTHYPRTLETDLQLLKEKGIHYCLVPQESELYTDDYRYRVEETQQASFLEGASRAGHFAGVLTIVMKLLQLVQPHRIYLGEKDYQQYELIRGMTEAFFMPVSVIVCPTIREPSGLAFSSRNNRLNPAQRQLADQFAQLFAKPWPLQHIRQALEDIGIQVDYLETIKDRRYAAVKIGDVRLIDNRVEANHA